MSIPLADTPGIALALWLAGAGTGAATHLLDRSIEEQNQHAESHEQLNGIGSEHSCYICSDDINNRPTPTYLTVINYKASFRLIS